MDNQGWWNKFNVRGKAIHAWRVGVFVFLLLMIRGEHSWHLEQRRGASKQLLSVERVAKFFPNATRIADEWDVGHGGQNVFDADEKRLGHVIQTSPEADEICGFSGPTNTLIAIGKDGRILGVDVLRTDDTKQHLEEVLRDESYLTQWNGLSRSEAAAFHDVDAVSGATLTSTAIADGIATRFGGKARTDRFPEKIRVEEVQAFLKDTASLEPIEKRPFLLKALDAQGNGIGFACRTSPHADHMLGYQGPTDILMVLDPEERVLGLSLRGTYDNEPFVTYVKEDEYFLNTFNGLTLPEVAEVNMVEWMIDGVSGATKTSITAAEAVIASAAEIAKVREPPSPKPWLSLQVRDVGTMLVVGLAMGIGFSPLRGRRWLRLAFQAVLVGYLGFVNADMVSQALLVGWARNGVPWSNAPGLVFLTAAALIAPVFTGRQIYCTHMCPFGAVQDWLAKARVRKFAASSLLAKTLNVLPVILLAWVLIVAMGHLPFSLVGIEPFDAFVFRIAGGASIAVAIGGVIVSVFSPRAYCRYGCPTGAMLKFLRFRGSAADRLGRRDLVAAAFALTALAMRVW